MTPTDATEYEFKLTFTKDPDADVPVPKGNGWELIQMAAESPGEDTSGGVWLLWRSKYNVRPEEREDRQ